MKKAKAEKGEAIDDDDDSPISDDSDDVESEKPKNEAVPAIMTMDDEDMELS